MIFYPIIYANENIKNKVKIMEEKRQSLSDSISDMLQSNEEQNKYQTVGEVHQAILNIAEYYTPQEGQPLVDKVWENLSESLRKNREAMLALVTIYPSSLTQAAPELLTKEYISEAMHRNPSVYDYLPEEMRVNSNVVDLFKDSLMAANMGQNNTEPASFVTIPDEEMNRLEEQIKACTNNPAQTVQTMQEIIDAMDKYGTTRINNHIDLQGFWNMVGMQIAELQTQQALSPSPDREKLLGQLTKDMSWERHSTFIMENIQKGHEQKLNTSPTTPVLETPGASIAWKKEGPMQNFNPLHITMEQARLVAAAQLEHEKSYQPLTPLEIPETPAGKVFRTMPEAIEALTNASTSHELGNALSRVPEYMRKNVGNMLDLIEATPHAYQIATPSLQKGLIFPVKAAERNPRVYDLMERRVQERQEVVDGYRQGTLKNVQWKNINHEINARSNTNNNMFIAVYDISPLCPRDKFYSVYGFKQNLRHYCENKDVLSKMEYDKGVKKMPTEPTLFNTGPARTGIKMFGSTQNGVRDVHIDGVGTVIGPRAVAMCATLAQTEELKRLRDIEFSVFARNFREEVGLQVYYPIMPMSRTNALLARDYSLEARILQEQYKAVLNEHKHLTVSKNPDKLFAKFEEQSRKQMCKDIRAALSPLESHHIGDNDRLPFDEPIEIAPKDMLYAMDEIPFKQLTRYVDSNTLGAYWQMHAEDVARSELARQERKEGPSPAIMEKMQLLEEVSQKHPQFAAIIKNTQEQIFNHVEPKPAPNPTEKKKWAFDMRPASEQRAPSASKNTGPLEEYVINELSK